MRWRRNTKTGNPMPLNFEPVAGGNIELVGDEQCRVLTKAELAEAGPGPRYVSHFSTCPNRAGHRKPRP